MRIRIDVYGPGCRKCAQSAEIAAKWLAARGVAGEVVKHTTIEAMTAAGVLFTPAVRIAGSAVVDGRVLKDADLDAWLARHPEART